MKTFLFLLLSLSLGLLSCKKSKDAEKVFNKSITSFEIFGFKFGKDEGRFTENLKQNNLSTHEGDIEKSLVSASNNIIPKVVHIHSELTSEKILSKIKSVIPKEYQDLIEVTSSDQSNQMQYSTGSGFIVAWDGLIVTNAHIVDGSKKITVTLNDKQKYDATLLGLDNETDIAVIKIETKNSLDPVTFSNSDDLKIGQMTVAVGRPLGYNSTVTAGFISALPVSINNEIEDQSDIIQTSAPIPLGSSGGPLLDLNGKVVGISVSILQEKTGIGFAVPSNKLKTIIDELVKNGKVVRSSLGVGLQDLTDELAIAFNYKPEGPLSGVVINEIFPGSPAFKADLKIGDLIINLNEMPIYNSAKLTKLISSIPVGSKSTLLIIRNGTKLNKSIFFTKPVEEKSYSQIFKWDWLGLQVEEKPMLEPVSMTVKNMLQVTYVAKASPAFLYGIMKNDIILKIDNEDVKSQKSYDDIINQAEKKGSIKLLIRRLKNDTHDNRFIIISKNKI